MSIKNTTEVDMHPEWLFGANPQAIERQEREGQKELVESSQLPRKVNHGDFFMAEEFYELIGIEVIGESEGDPLFCDVVLPDGWKIKPMDHSMWSELIDSNDVVRATIFYKAAFYDRDAFVNVKIEEE